MNPQDPRYVDWLVELARKNLDGGVIEEPRVYYDVATLPSSAPYTVPFTANVFRNGEQFPVRITHMIASVRPDWSGEVAVDTDERLIQHVTARMRWHDTYYMAQQYLPLPLWVNKPLAGAEATQQGSTSWIFDRPLIMSARDSFRVQVALEQGVGVTRAVSMGFTGIGLLSKRPYFFGQTPYQLANYATTQIPSRGYVNDGAEPVAITDLTTQVTSTLDNANPSGDARAARWNVRQIGNGTQTDWFQGPPGLSLMPGSLLGISTGRSVVHRFPGDGIVWEPGEGVQVELGQVAGTTDVQGADVLLAFVGYISLR